MEPGVPREAANAFYNDLRDALAERKVTKRELAKLKKHFCKIHGIASVPSDRDVFLHLPGAGAAGGILAKPVRTFSGVAPVSVATAPLGCPHGKCTFCPGGPDSVFGNVPQSYTGREPSIARSALANYDPYVTIMNRLAQYAMAGHSPEKVEMIIQGATFPAYPELYQIDFVRGCFSALNDFSRVFYENGILNYEKFIQFFELPAAPRKDARLERIICKILELKSKNNDSLEAARDGNEHSHIKCVGLTIETKPDWGFAGHGRRMLNLGCTRVELGVQTTYDDILQKTHRGHTVNDTKRSIRELRDLAFKLNFHVMPGLPGATRAMDLAAFETYFSDPAYRPDMLKIYPCLVMRGTALYQHWKAGEFTPLTTEQAADLIVECKKIVPTYCRIMRVQRDIPTKVTSGGAGRTNLRQYVQELASERGVACRCIRCRESKGARVDATNIQISVDHYEASNGREYFISAVAGDTLLGFVRMRFPGEMLLSQITESSALIREIHVYGFSTPMGASVDLQHRGLGAQLLRTAEEIALQNAKNKMVVISAAGVRGYFRKFNYQLDGAYMSKML